MCDDLLTHAFGCHSCPEAYGFSSPTTGGPYFKFPPVIGCHSKPRLLFVGINPRKTSTNLRLHEQLMSDFDSFVALSRNEHKDVSYIVSNGDEGHYRFHTRIVAELFGLGTPFESVAAASELYLCATVDCDNLPALPVAPCAEKFLLAIIDALKPEIIVAVGGTVFQYFQGFSDARSSSGSWMLQHSTVRNTNYRIVGIPHPADVRISEEQKATRVSMAIKLLTALLSKQQ